MVTRISRDLIRRCLDDFASTRIDDDGDIFTIMSADRDFNHDVIVYFIVDEDWVSVHGYASNYEVSDNNKGRVILALNDFNKEYKVVKGCLVNNNTIRLEHAFLFAEGVTEEHIKRNLKLALSTIWKGFCEIDK